MQKIKVVNIDFNVERYFTSETFREEVASGLKKVRGNKVYFNIYGSEQASEYMLTVCIDLNDTITVADGRVTIAPGTLVGEMGKAIKIKQWLSFYIPMRKMRDIITTIRIIRNAKRYKQFKMDKVPSDARKIVYPTQHGSRFDYIAYYDSLREPQTEDLIDYTLAHLRNLYNAVKTLNFTTMVDVLTEEGHIVRRPVTFEIAEDEFLDIVNGKIHSIVRKGTMHRYAYRYSKEASEGYILPFEIKIDKDFRATFKDMFKTINKRIKQINGYRRRNYVGTNLFADGSYGAVYRGYSNCGNKRVSIIDQRDYFYDDAIKIIEGGE